MRGPCWDGDGSVVWRVWKCSIREVERSLLGAAWGSFAGIVWRGFERVKWGQHGDGGRMESVRRGLVETGW